MISLVQIFLSLFFLFAISRVLLRFREGKVKLPQFIFWTVTFISAAILVLFPNQTTKIAGIVGIGRGVDLIVYGSIAALFYLVFRIYVLLEDIRSDVTEIVRKIALRDKNENSPRH